MMFKSVVNSRFFHFSISLLVCLFAIRGYEYFAASLKFYSTNNVLLSEIHGLWYDYLAWGVFTSIVLLIYYLVSLLNQKIANVLLHILNLSLLFSSLALLYVFIDRSVPFDHELFTREGGEQWQTIRTYALKPLSFLPFLLAIVFYFGLYHFVFRKIELKSSVKKTLFGIIVLPVFLLHFIVPSPASFEQTAQFNLACNKVTFWCADVMKYFYEEQHHQNLTAEEMQGEFAYYQANRPCKFSSTEYPLMHQNTNADVLGKFFNLGKERPNIVMVVVESLSSTFSGKKAPLTSFTPFIDQLAEKSLCWENHLSNATATFGVFPATLASLPFGRKGFTNNSSMPDHQSLISILKQNGYYSYFMVGYPLDYDNIGGFIRMEKTDFILSNFGKKYKMMSAGNEGWSMGYPDDAVFNRSFEVLDSLKRQPYLNVYMTATMHAPFLFDSQPKYMKLFDKKLKTRHLAQNVKMALQRNRQVMSCVMFTDDELRNFFKKYSRRPEYKNTIFILTGDHHHGSVPAHNEIDWYRVPFMIYSPMLKSPKKFASINCHNNITPTLLGMLAKNYNLPHVPNQVHWVNGVMDTATHFRNIHQISFMTYSRKMESFMYKDNFLYLDRLYKIHPDMSQTECLNKALIEKTTRLRENYVAVNNWVYENNKIMPTSLSSLKKRTLIAKVIHPAEQNFESTADFSAVTKNVTLPTKFKFLYVEVDFDCFTAEKDSASVPMFSFVVAANPALQSYKELFTSFMDLHYMSKVRFMPDKWNSLKVTDVISMEQFIRHKHLGICTGFKAESKVGIKVRNFRMNLFGMN